MLVALFAGGVAVALWEGRVLWEGVEGGHAKKRSKSLGDDGEGGGEGG